MAKENIIYYGDILGVTGEDSGPYIETQEVMVAQAPHLKKKLHIKKRLKLEAYFKTLGLHWNAFCVYNDLRCQP